MKKDPHSIGKLSSRRIKLFDSSRDKKVSALLPLMQDSHRKSRLSKSAFLADGKQDPLPHIKTGSRPLKMRPQSLKNPQDEIFFIDGNKQKIGHCIAIQMSSPRHSQAGKLYNPSLLLAASPGKIRRQAKHDNKAQKEATEAVKNFKNFLQHRYVQEVKEKRTGMTLIEYDHRLSDSVVSTAFFDKRQAKEMSQEQIGTLPVCSQGETKSFYLSTSFVKMNEILFISQGDHFRQCYKEQLNGSYIQGLNDFHDTTFLINASNSSNQTLSMQSSVSRIKQLLIQEQSFLSIQLFVPSVLKEPLRNLTSQPQIHRAANDIFFQLAKFKPQLISLKKYANCILIVAKSPMNFQHNFALVWHYNGNFYFGQWQATKQQKGRRQILGIEYKANQYLYLGQYRDNKQNGYGIMKKQSGQTYVGEWRNGQRNGWGKQFESNGKIILDGTFQNDNFVENRLEKHMI